LAGPKTFQQTCSWPTLWRPNLLWQWCQSQVSKVKL